MLNKNCPGNESLTIALTDLRYFSMRSFHTQMSAVVLTEQYYLQLIFQTVASQQYE